LPLAAVAALLGAAMVAAVFANPTIGVRKPPVAQDTGEPWVEDTNAAPPPPQESDTLTLPQSLPGGFSLALTVLCVAVIVVVLGLLLWFLVRERLGERRAAVAEAPDDTQVEMRRRVRAAVDEGLADLDAADTDPRRAVIACWVRLEEAAAAAGTRRELGDTSTELVARLLSSHQVNAGVLAGLAAIYREARFATHPVDQTTRDRARAALRLLRDELGAPTGGRVQA
jgi:hypothetical protein